MALVRVVTVRGGCRPGTGYVRAMTYSRSRALSAATAAYGLFALVKPRHLGDALEAPHVQRSAVDQIAYTYAVRDLSISAMALLGSPALVRAAMALRVAGDLGDAAILSRYAPNQKVRSKVLAVTLGWGVLNTAALLADEKATRASL